MSRPVMNPQALPPQVAKQRQDIAQRNVASTLPKPWHVPAQKGMRIEATHQQADASTGETMRKLRRACAACMKFWPHALPSLRHWLHFAV